MNPRHGYFQDRRSLAVAALLLVLPATARGQFCFRDTAPSACTVVGIVEFGGLWVNEDNFRPDNITTSFWEVGALKKRADGPTAYGASLYASYDDSSYRTLLWAVKARARYRLSRYLMLDLGAGPIVAVHGESDLVHMRLPGLTLRATVNLADWVGLAAGFDAYRLRISSQVSPVGRDRLRDEQWSWYVGLQANGYLGAVIGIVGAVLTSFWTQVGD